jgi:hypothetical protein
MPQQRRPQHVAQGAMIIENGNSAPGFSSNHASGYYTEWG